MKTEFIGCGLSSGYEGGRKVSVGLRCRGAVRARYVASIRGPIR